VKCIFSLIITHSSWWSKC